MNKIPAIAIFDIGKTNKKLLLFDEQYQLLYEQSDQLPETTDEDGDACEDVNALACWVRESFTNILQEERFLIKAINVSAYGASFVHLDENGNVMLPLYNYLKPYPENLLNQFYKDHGEEKIMAKDTASPSLGSLNSGLQLYRIKYQTPGIFDKIKWSLHLPQYISYVLSSQKNSEITSIGCHTYLWNFRKNDYHSWVHEEGIDEKFPPIRESDKVAGYARNKIPVGVGLHDSSAAMIPYLISFREPFVLLSTGTWNISLNPFNNTPLTDFELQNDCLRYLSYDAKPIKASRLFAGYEHEKEVKKLAGYFDKPIDYYTSISYDPALFFRKKIPPKHLKIENKNLPEKPEWNSESLNIFESYEEAYHHFILHLVKRQVASTEIVLEGTKVKRMFVDGGFSKNLVFMQMLSQAFPGLEVYAASVAQASALGAALCFHHNWNRENLPADLIELKRFQNKKQSPI